jgi:hypothetical protein
MIWKKALDSGLAFTLDPTAVNSRISFAEDALSDEAFSAVEKADIQSSEIFLSDPRVEPSEIRYREGDTLFHIALRKFTMIIFRLPTVLSFLNDYYQQGAVHQKLMIPGKLLFIRGSGSGGICIRSASTRRPDESHVRGWNRHQCLGLKRLQHTAF